MSLITDAQREITEILAKLEEDTQSLVIDIHIEGLDVTGFSHNRQQLQRRVVIEMQPIPGTAWAK